ncbi:uncharacterized protein ACA1_304320 [Acanthamoeba castellanii str. Neff]|uniref:Uncharacterized protein n=1 Tax=Acanthamoeba castellanii (strain ATCC 30010 / Neff) TaxID=1257118 RepID=L8GVE6_ACACF|nr:uncharacterized protein ACA1_304320 [Acanthamoeba castellanii str. Neff]ELR16990.1 hypothetical protein ACA1_304320 [Acanthamoeba castellanii str. Neff]
MLHITSMAPPVHTTNLAIADWFRRAQDAGESTWGMAACFTAAAEMRWDVLEWLLHRGGLWACAAYVGRPDLIGWIDTIARCPIELAKCQIDIVVGFVADIVRADPDADPPYKEAFDRARGDDGGVSWIARGIAADTEQNRAIEMAYDHAFVYLRQKILMSL